MIYPSRSLEIIKRNLKDPKELLAEVMRSTTVNLASMRSLAELKHTGHIVLVFPSGTRYRPWDPSTKQGVREIDSYVKSFAKMCLIAVNGNILRLNPEGEMMDDLICQDRVQYTVGPVLDCAEFRDPRQARAPFPRRQEAGHGRRNHGPARTHARGLRKGQARFRRRLTGFQYTSYLNIRDTSTRALTWEV